MENELEVVESMQFGCLSPYCINYQENRSVAPKDPHMQLVDRRISNVRDLLLSKDVEGLAILVSCGRPVEAVSNARTALAHVSTPRKEDPGRS